jgi:hypothetical protein
VFFLNIYKMNFTGKDRPAIAMRTIEIEGEICGISLTHSMQKKSKTKICISHEISGGNIPDQILENAFEDHAIEVGTNRHADDWPLKAKKGCRYLNGKCYYWTNQPANKVPAIPQVYTRELTTDDVILFEECVFGDGGSGWPEFPGLITNGIRYFGCFDSHGLLSICGLCRTTAFTEEIVAVT